ncbi:MAG: sugar kinase [Marivita sp.]|uniref:sugar kinase n=1 Tax=Marivita sp. TaxID=2003365 RepID=UPI003EF37B1A
MRRGTHDVHVLAIGECMAELAPADAPSEYQLGFAGDTFNTAWYLARLSPDLNVSYFTAAGTDAISDQMRAAITAGGIDVSHVQTVPNRTVGLYLISLDNGERSFSYWRGQSAARQLADDPKALAIAMAEARLIYFSGITLGILDAAARDTLFDALRTARAAGKTIAFDPNLRPRLWDNTDAMLDATMQGAAVSDVVLPSFEDEADWFGDADPQTTAKRYAAAGATTIVVKNGADPVYFQHDGTQGTVPACPVTKVVDTTAAGDSFNAVVLAGLLDDTPLDDSTTHACRLASQVVQGKGALVSINLDLLDP